MPLIQPGQGSVPSKFDNGLMGMGDALQSFVDSYQREKRDQEDKKNSNDDIIKAGLSSKTMRPAKDSENADFKDSSGRSWVYDDSSIKEEHAQANNQRKDAHWITINSNVERELQQAINSGQIQGTDIAAQNTFRNQRIAQYLGVGANGKMDSALKDDLSPEGQAWVDSMTAGPSSGKGSPNPTGVTYSPQMFAQNAASLASSNINAGQHGHGGTPSWSLMNAPYQSAGRGVQPLSQDQQNMDALMSILAMQGNQPPMINPQGVGPTQQQLAQPILGQQ